jgi:hypothetical protein
MKQLIIKANGCHDCPLKNSYFECRLIDEDVELECDNFDFHKDCPMVEVNND